jgi:hypothetical protein
MAHHVSVHTALKSAQYGLHGGHSKRSTTQGGWHIGSHATADGIKQQRLTSSVNEGQCEYTEAEIGHTDSNCLCV